MFVSMTSARSTQGKKKCYIDPAMVIGAFDKSPLPNGTPTSIVLVPGMGFHVYGTAADALTLLGKTIDHDAEDAAEAASPPNPELP